MVKNTNKIIKKPFWFYSFISNLNDCFRRFSYSCYRSADFSFVILTVKSLSGCMIVFGVQEAESTSNNWWTFDNYYKRKNFERTDWKKERINVKAVPQLTTNANDFEKKRIVKNKKENDFQKMWNDAWITKDIYSDSLKYSSRRVINILSKLWAVTSWPWGSKMKLKNIWRQGTAKWGYKKIEIKNE